MATKVPRIIMQGTLILAKDIVPHKGNPDPSPRGEVKGFSPASRRRMIQQCAKMGKSIPIFVTLTYGKDFPFDPAVWKKDLASWIKRLRRFNSKLSGIWRLEPQKRGAPHYHLLIYQENGKKPFIPLDWVASAWNKVVKGDADHLRAGTRIESLDSHRGAAFYCAKYCAKLPDDDDFPPEWEKAGRLWGSFNKSNLPEAPQREMVLHSLMEQQAVLFAMKDAYKESFIARSTSEYEKSLPDKDKCIAGLIAQKDWDDAVSDNKHFGNTSTHYGDAEQFLKRMSEKITAIEISFIQRFGASKALSMVDSLAAEI